MLRCAWSAMKFEILISIVVSFILKKNETIHAENSYKYDVDEFICLAGNAGFVSKQVWFDDDRLFGVHLLVV